jgi:hypothetical protein
LRCNDVTPNDAALSRERRMLRRFVAAAFLVCALATLSGCSPVQSLYLINNTGHTVIVIESAGRWRDMEGVVNINRWGRTWPWPFLVKEGAGRRVDSASGREWIVDVRVGRCRLRYEAPLGSNRVGGPYDSSAWRAYDFWRYDITMQLEPDERLYLVALRVPQNGRPAAVDVSPFRDIQPEGYPVAPSSRVCR